MSYLELVRKNAKLAAEEGINIKKIKWSSVPSVVYNKIKNDLVCRQDDPFFFDYENNERLNLFTYDISDLGFKSHLIEEINKSSFTIIMVANEYYPITGKYSFGLDEKTWRLYIYE